jgi:hypothetical protein
MSPANASEDPGHDCDEDLYRGPEKIEPQSAKDQDLSGAAECDDGVWRVVFKRSLTTPSAKGDVQFMPGEYVPFAVMAWDGGAGESGLRHSVSSWYSQVLEAPIPRQVYVRAGLGMLLTLLVEIALLRKSGALTTGRSDG